jgi:iron complex outermembrane recepter protein
MKFDFARATGSASMRCALVLSGALLVSVSLPNDTRAAGDPAAQTPESVASATLDDIVVTAQKRESRLQDVPVTLTAFSGKELEDIGARDFKDILMSVPGVSYAGVDRGQSQYNIRGVSSVATAPTVALYLNDVSLVTGSNVFTGTADLLFFDIDRVEVLKGPQGTLYGGSSMGGAIKYVDRSPNLSELSGEAAAGGAGTHGGDPSYNGEAIVNIPIVQDTLAVRFGVAYRLDGGFVDNVSNAPVVFPDHSINGAQQPYSPLIQPSQSTFVKDGVNEAATSVAKASVLWQPDSSFSVLASAFYQAYKLDSPTAFFPNLPGLESSYRSYSPTYDNIGVFRLAIHKDLGPVTFDSLTGFVDRRMLIERDYSYFIGNLIPSLYANDSTSNSHIDTTTLTQELRLASKDDPDSKWRWITGLYFSRQPNHFDQDVLIPGAIPVLGTELSYFGTNDEVERQYAAFGQVSYNVTQRLEVSVGLRLFDIKQSLNTFGEGPLNGGTSEIIGRDTSEHGVTPRYAVSYHVTPDNLLYASAAKGFRAGGPNLFQIDANLCRADLDRLGRTTTPDSYLSDNLWTYEIGSKNQDADHKFTVNASAFYTSWNKIQQQVFLTSCGFSYTDNVGAADIRGAELETVVKPLDPFTLGATASFTDTRITNAALGTPAQVGDSIQFVPKWMFSAYGVYGIDLDSISHLSFRLDWQYQGSVRQSYDGLSSVSYAGGGTGTIPNALEYRNGYGLAGAQVMLQRGRVDYRVFIDNMFNARPLINDYGADQGIAVASTLRPRTFGAEVRVHF